MIRYFFWDFDGTLYDSYPVILSSVRAALSNKGVSDLYSDHELMKLLKVSLAATFWDIEYKTGISHQELSDLYHADQDLQSEFTLYPGAELAIHRLFYNGCHHFLYSHRDIAAIKALEKDGLSACFDDYITASDHFPKKPAPDALLFLVNKHHLDPNECVMVGDRDIDIEAGHNAGMHSLLFDPDGYYMGYHCEGYFNNYSDIYNAIDMIR